MENNLPRNKKLWLYLLVFIFSTILFFIFPPVSVDWVDTYYPVAIDPLQPYKIKSFHKAPWTALIIYPLQFFSENIGLVLNASITLLVFIALVVNNNGKLLSIVLTMTSFPVLSGISNGALEWIPALGFLLQDGFGVLFVLTKPQSGVFAGLDWFIRSKNKIVFLLIPTVTIILSLFIWPDWPSLAISNVLVQEKGLQGRNMSLFPWSIPIGLGLLYYIIKKRPENGEFFGVLATAALTPYSALQSYSVLFALLSTSYPKASIVVWVPLWIFAFLTKGSAIT